MMKLLVVLVCIGAAMAKFDPTHFQKMLGDIRSSKEFTMMTQDEQDLFQKLVAAEDTSPLAVNALIQQEGFDKILAMIDHLDADDISKFDEYLSYYLDPSGFLLHQHHKRAATSMQLFQFIREMHLVHEVEKDLHHEDRPLFMKMMYAVEHDELTQFISEVGYTEFMRLLSEVDKDQIHDLDHMVIEHLNRESAMGNGPVTTMPPMMTSPTTMV